MVADSKSPYNSRLSTMQVTFPRYILAELNTHRMFSRNSASSRAIPFKKMVQSVRDNPFIPIAWQNHHSGMQGSSYTQNPDMIAWNREMWLKARDYAIEQATELDGCDVTKQLTNRLLEPFMWHTVLISSTEWENFFALRCPQYAMTNSYGRHFFRSKKDYLRNVGLPDMPAYYSTWTDLDWLKINKGQADIHMMALAECMWECYRESKPKLLKAGEFHIPFGDQINEIELGKLLDAMMPIQPASLNWYQDRLNELLIKVSVAMCARISYTVVGEEGKPVNFGNDIKLYHKLKESGHMSPFEHIGQVMTSEEYYSHVCGKVPGSEFLIRMQSNVTSLVDSNLFGWSGNFRGFIQHRKTLPRENITANSMLGS